MSKRLVKRTTEGAVKGEVTVLLPVTRAWAMKEVIASIAASDIPRGKLILVLDAPGCEAWASELARIGFSVETHVTGNPHPPNTRSPGSRRKRHSAMRRLTQTLVPDGPLLCLEDDGLVPSDVYARLTSIGPNATGVQVSRYKGDTRCGVYIGNDPQSVGNGAQPIDACGHYCLLTTGEAYKAAKITGAGAIDRAHTAQIPDLRADWDCVVGHLTQVGALWPKDKEPGLMAHRVHPNTPRKEKLRKTPEAVLPMVDFCVVSYNSTRDVGRLLLQLSMTYPGPYTVTVIDNSHTNRGFSKACNIAAKGETAPYIAFLNPDITLCDKWAEATVAALEADETLAIAGPRLDDGLPWPRDTLRWSGVHNWVCGAAFFVRRTFFESVGGFDERYFFSCEETDLCRQAEAKGLRCETVGEPRVKHIRHPSTFHDEQLAIAAKQYGEKWSV